jgi:hypothetical protein
VEVTIAVKVTKADLAAKVQAVRNQDGIKGPKDSPERSVDGRPGERKDGRHSGQGGGN